MLRATTQRSSSKLLLTFGAWSLVGEAFVHIECSLDADAGARREARFTGKFERGRRYIGPLFDGLELDAEPDQVALLQFGGGDRSHLGGGASSGFQILFKR